MLVDKMSNFHKSTVKSTVVPHLSSDAPPSLLTENGQVFNNSILQSLQGERRRGGDFFLKKIHFFKKKFSRVCAAGIE